MDLLLITCVDTSSLVFLRIYLMRTNKPKQYYRALKTLEIQLFKIQQDSTFNIFILSGY